MTVRVRDGHEVSPGGVLILRKRENSTVVRRHAKRGKPTLRVAAEQDIAASRVNNARQATPIVVEEERASITVGDADEPVLPVRLAAEVVEELISRPEDVAIFHPEERPPIAGGLIAHRLESREA